MKTLKQRLDELRNEAINKIINEDYTYIDLIINGSDHYQITLFIDGCKFEISIPVTLKYIVHHDYDFKISNGEDEKIAKLIYERHIEPIMNKEIEKRIKELQKKLK